MNSLGIGNSGKSFNLVPNNLTNQNRFSKINLDFLESVKQVQKHNNKGKKFSQRQNLNEHYKNFQNDILNLKKTNQNKQKIQNNDSLNQSDIQNNNTLRSQNESINESFDDVQTDDMGLGSSYSNNINWTEIFLTVCKKRLFNYFRELKMILNTDSYFSNLLICYIDENSAKYLIKNSKNKGVLTLRMMLNNIVNNQIKSANNIDLNNSINLTKALDLVKNLELMGPSNNLLIALSKEQIKNIQTNYLKGKELYWPNGNEGITWLSSIN